MASGIKKSKAPKKEKEVTLEQVLWNCRVALRGFGSFEKNRDSVIGLAFLKFAGDKFEKRRKEIIAEYGDICSCCRRRVYRNRSCGKSP